MSQNLSLDRRLALMQLADSFFPSGSFTLSHGLEVLVHTKQVQSIDDFQNFLRLLLHNKIGSADLIALVHAYRASEQNNVAEVRNVDLKLFAQTPIQEIREAQRRSGKALLSVACSTWDDPQLQAIRAYTETGYTPCLHPIIFAIVGRAANLTEDDTIFAFLHNFLTGLCGAAIRLGVLGHLKAQFVIKEIAVDLQAIAHQASLSDLNEMQSCAPFIDIAQMTHKQLSQRLFSN
ncbi:urease accessory protein UreF [Chroococcidiopsis sp. TS-821]|uniref:urease accessory protein UreF n=1 Tax=Chroococcidiopsis sp. TS-821 TaxID=1378066 RepID=UPI000CEF0AC0|nr:urease accessory UreF family protein [Chroococcidiopsis sp. TS-821]PPS41909.1 urease accessory protein UreF [Chroococcidiopsis sp. TS-821]